MIYDSIINFKNYISLHPLFPNVSDFLDKDFSSLESGKHQIGNGIVANINIYKTKNISDCFIECHKQFIDIQIVISGCEKIGFLHKTDCVNISDYDETKDLLKLDGKPNFITFKPGFFGVFFKDDAHMPQVTYNESEEVKKLVIKVPVF